MMLVDKDSCLFAHTHSITKSPVQTTLQQMVDHRGYPNKHELMYENYMKNTDTDDSVSMSKHHYL